MKTTRVVLHGTEEAKIDLRLNVPFGCAVGVKNCSLDVNVFIPQSDQCQADDISLKQNLRKPCGIQLFSEQVGVPRELKLQGKFGGNTIKSQRRHLVARLVTHNVVPSHPYFQRYFLDPVTVSLFCLFDFCFTALQHILGHFGLGQLPNHSVPLQAS